MRKFVCLLAVLSIEAQLTAQTRIDLNTQTRNVDFSAAASTRPFKVGSSLPATCREGDMFFRVGNPTQVLYACTATNLWMLQSGSAAGIGLLAQTSEGTITRALAASSGILIVNADGENGNPEIRADIASQTEAEAGALATKLMTPQRTLQAFTTWNPIPSQAGKAKSLLVTNGATSSWTWKLITPASAVQTILTASSPITADRLFVKVLPASPMTMTATPVIGDGEDGQFVTITNVSATASVTFQDEALAPGSNVRLGGTNLTLAPNQSATFVFATGPGDWILTQKLGSDGSQFASLSDVSINSPVEGQCAIYSAATGKWQNRPCPTGGGGDITSAQAQANSRLYCADAGSTDTYTCSVTPALLTYTTGMVVWFRPNTSNSGSATININSLGAKTITTESDSVLVDDTLRAGYTYPLWYDGNTFRVIWSSMVRPNPTNNEQKFITTDGVSEIYDARFAPPPDEQTITTNSPLILPLSTNVFVTPDSNRTLCNASGLISDGAFNGQWLYIHNTTNFTLEWSDKENCTGSKLDFGGSNFTQEAKGGLSVMWASPYWVLMSARSNGGSEVVVPSTANLLKGDNAGGVLAATAGADYVIPSGNVATAGALAANPSNCSAGSYPLGVAADGSAEDCTFVPSVPNTLNVLKGNNAGEVLAATPGTDYVIPSGNVATATSLAANPANCSAGSYPLGIAADGSVENCTAVTGGGAPADAGDVFSSVDGDRIHGTALSTQTGALSTNIRVMRVVFYKPMTFSKLTAQFIALASSSAGYALYDSSKNILMNSGAVDTQSGSIKTVSVGSATFQPGVYYIAWGTDNSSLQTIGIGLGSTRYSMLSVTSGIFFTNSGTSYSNITGMPSTLGTLTKAESSGFPVMQIYLHN
jgi:hypothetical protein